MNPLSQILNRHQFLAISTMALRAWMSTPAKQISLNEVEWTLRAKNALNTNGITTIKQLACFNGKELQKGKNIGTTTLREFIRGCLPMGFVPEWIKDVKLAHHPVYICPRDFVAIAGPYASSERWMLELAIAQLGTLPWCVVQDETGLTLCRGRSGYVEVEPEE